MKPFEFFCNNTTTIVWKDANENICIALPYSVILRTCAFLIAYLISWNSLIGSSFHSNFSPFFNILDIGLLISSKLVTNLLKKIICPKKIEYLSLFWAEGLYLLLLPSLDQFSHHLLKQCDPTTYFQLPQKYIFGV